MTEETQQAPAPESPAKKRDRHLYQIDFVRLVTFAGVILDHVAIGIAATTLTSMGALGLLLRYTRYSFFALTGFVLTYQYRNRDLRPVEFWRRRYKLIGLPFVVWSLFYWTYGRYRVGGFDALERIFSSAETIGRALKSIVYDLITGGAWYHLYFLSVSMQIYLVFPAVLWVLKRTWGYHRYILVVSGIFQALVMYAMLRPRLPIFHEWPLNIIYNHITITLIPYQFFVLAGCIAAMHYEAFQAFMIRWRWPLIGISFATIVATLCYYVWDVNRGTSIMRASNVFMLHNVFALIGIIVILYCLGTIWQTRRTQGSFADHFMRIGADRSFGIYLAHALALSELQPIITRHRDDWQWPLLLVAFLATAVLTVFIVEVLRRSPISLITTGRSTIDWHEQNWMRSLLVGVVAIVVGVAIRLGMVLTVGNLIAAFGALLVISALVVAVKQRRSVPVAA